MMAVPFLFITPFFAFGWVGVVQWLIGSAAYWLWLARTSRSGI
jgi:hypothetical protein